MIFARPNCSTLLVAALQVAVVSAILFLPGQAFGLAFSDVAVHDNRLESRTDLADKNNGGETVLVLGGDSVSDFQRSILRFDLSSVPGNHLATAPGTLTLTVQQLTGGIVGRTIELWKIKPANAGWIEGDGGIGTPNANGESTWNSHDHPNAWLGGSGLGADSNGSGLALPGDGFEGATPGDSTPVATFTVPSGIAVNDSIVFTVPESVINDWLADPSGNAGFLLRDANETSLTFDGIRFDSSEGTQGERPLLEFQTVAIPEPGTAGLVLLGGAWAARWRRRRGPTPTPEVRASCSVDAEAGR